MSSPEHAVGPEEPLSRVLELMLAYADVLAPGPRLIQVGGSQLLSVLVLLGMAGTVLTGLFLQP